MYKKVAFLSLLVVISITQALGQRQSMDEIIRGATTYFSLDTSSSAPSTLFFEGLFKQNRFVVLGEYHGSTRISELTSYLLPLYAQQNGHLLAMEIGPNPLNS